MQELYVNSFSASASSAINEGLDVTLAKFAHRPLEESYPHLIVDARYEKVRGSGTIRSKAALIALRPMARSTNGAWGTSRLVTTGEQPSPAGRFATRCSKS
ncbi:transposase [Paraburkholderia aromaticivorans]|uniref:transposase n=1 Tax=Paraburkholderia aromaticivorans TaxID=2026199 RepID=UPI00145618F4